MELSGDHSLGGFPAEIEQSCQVVFFCDLGVEGMELYSGHGVSAFGGSEVIEETG